VTVGPHDQVQGSNPQPGRLIWNLETPDVHGNFERLKAAGATVVQEPYQPGEAAETHHQVFRITDGADDDWASWYAQWLVTRSELPQVLGGTVVRSELTYLLVRLDKEYTERRSEERWEDFYARGLVRHFSQGDA
jgi:hypothetical protein